MSIIKLLPENLVNQIAAGEVVERPASVVKELVENSLDAGADRIEIELKDGGKTFIRVADNGKGMSRDDLEMSLQRHATSKIKEEKDLWNIGTMGFRGEALASICSVSKFFLRSKTAESVGGFEICAEGGDIKQIKEVGMNTGTQVEVYDLFFNTPARQKYLKQDSTELGRVTGLMNQIALANPRVAFKLIHNDKNVFDWSKKTDLISRLAEVLGGGAADAMIPVFFGGSAFQIDGFVGKPLLSRTTTQHQYFLVNGRPIQHALLANRIRAAYHSMLMEEKKPVFVMNITIDPALIDVNVHPRKLEIRFEDQEALVRAVYGAVKTALEKENLMPRGFSESQRYMSDSFPKVGGAFGGGGFTSGNDFNCRTSEKEIQNTLGFNQKMFEARDQQNIAEEIENKIEVLSQINNSYIVAKDANGLILIDQHAAHERVRYEELMKQFHNQEKMVQPLLTPLQIELSGEEISLMEENMQVFNALGFDIEEFGGNTFIVNSVPACLSGEDLDGVIKGVLDDIANSKAPTEMQGRAEVMLTYMSCRSAIKFGQKLGFAEMQSLIEQLFKMERPYTCPHGRPTMVSLSMNELARMFGRK